ncbi:riboflavin synthase [Metasolibacillus sp. FSL K6-0083]|uniref:riboflavin synthase n=1 Tax=Metasolibacillus sp. FSL K6-0083 TaxID=2921416 RepID=UPI00079BF877|nr:riboflavin synthase subunit alpha [[Bacillus] sp. KCTC 13219]
MFTGIIEELGTIEKMAKGQESIVLTIGAKKVIADLKVGDSIAVNGVCLTVTSFTNTKFTTDVMPETVRATSLSQLQIGSVVNLERAMAANGRFGGHFVSGHIDEVGTILRKRSFANAVYFDIKTSHESTALCIPRGSIAIDGISLTIFDLQKEMVTISIIPHTFNQTTLGFKREGDLVNIETDLLGKYIAKQLQTKSTTLTEDFLQQNGF